MWGCEAPGRSEPGQEGRQGRGRARGHGQELHQGQALKLCLQKPTEAEQLCQDPPKEKEEKKTNRGKREEDGTKIQAEAVTHENASF